MQWAFRFDKVRIPRVNLLNAVADVTPDGRYESAIKDPEQVGGLCSLGPELLAYSCSCHAKAFSANFVQQIQLSV